MPKTDLCGDLCQNSTREQKKQKNIERSRVQTRSRRGCATCRIRKVKCDETFPECQNCLRTCRKCEGPGVSVVIPKHKTSGSQVDDQRRLSSDPRPYPWAATDPEELRAFRYYSAVVVGTIGAGFDLEFWSKQVLGYAYENRSIWYSVLAISVLSEHGNPDNKLPCDVLDTERKSVSNIEPMTLAIRWYDQALKHAGLCRGSTTVSPSMEQDSARDILFCFLSLVIELQLGNARNVLRLSDIAFQLLAQVDQGRATDGIFLTLIPILFRFSAALSLYGYRLPDSAKKIAASCSIRLEEDTRRSLLLLLRTQLFDCLYSAHCLMQQGSSTSPSDQTKERAHIMQKLTAWQQEFTHCCQQITSRSDDTAQSMLVLTLRIISCSLRIQLHCYSDETSLLYNNYEQDFAAILEDTRSLSIFERSALPVSKFSFEFGYIPCLLFVAWHCRQNDLRQDTLALLSQNKFQQSFWTSAGVHDLAAAVIKLENASDTVESDGTARKSSIGPTCFRASFQIGLAGDGPEVDAGSYSILFRHRSFPTGVPRG